MFFNAKNGLAYTSGGPVDYIAFGRGSKNLVILPGLGDGLKTVKGMALTMALMYRILAADFRVYMFSRGRNLPENADIEYMAAELKEAMDSLGINRASVLGVSMGGAIAQHLAAEYPDMVEKLVLAVSYAAVNDTVRESVAPWIEKAQRGDFAAIFADTAERSYTEKKLRLYRPLYPILGRFTTPRDPGRFIIMAKACLEHDARAQLSKIKAPTLVVGGDCDKVVGACASAELASLIEGAELCVYKGYSHGLYEEAPDFNKRVFEFIK